MLLWRQFVIEWKLYARDRVAMFWSLAFPVLMLAGFGTIFRGADGPKLTLVWVEPGGAVSAGLRRAVEESGVRALPLSEAEAAARWARGETAVQIEPAPGGPGLRLRVNSYLLAQGQMTAQVVQQAFLIAQARQQGSPDPARIPVAVESPGRAHATNYAAFLLPGLLGLNLLSMGLFSVGMVNVAYREKGKFRRLAVTPLPKWIFLMGQVLHRLSLTVLQSALVIGAGRLFFGIANQGSYLDLAVVLGIGTGAFMAMGFALASFAETTETYAAISNLAFFPMMFLSGVYFTLDAAPRWLQQAVVALPLSPYIRALRAVFNDGSGLGPHLLGLALVAAWGLAAFVLAVRRFRFT
jgi:ABC-type multidrug transport system permease subunit